MLIFTIIVIALVAMIDYRMRTVKDIKSVFPDMPIQSQDDCYVKLASELPKMKTYEMYGYIQKILEFQTEYGETIDGKVDVTNLLNLFEDRHNALTYGFPEFIENFN